MKAALLTTAAIFLAPISSVHAQAGTENDRANQGSIAPSLQASNDISSAIVGVGVQAFATQIDSPVATIPFRFRG
ncbi:hypothetical protein U5A82_15620 [Sphingobium sp. CR2-8]|uniref:hypothetical protein n=1 Tax=Sphingobium sp. CR2-8 TaxID=1306534 RepID=UPI002DB97FC9|nr:hypothetical protein [Sphingobium sp. CR2-8]MEC3911845.1 hypothetical protein [Sphingobium sp. CR2-8]